MSACTCPNCGSHEVCSVGGTDECQSCGWLADGGMSVDDWKYAELSRRLNG